MWTLVGNVPNNSSGMGFSFQTANKAYICTGLVTNGSNATTGAVYLFDPINNSWTLKKNVPENQLGDGVFNFYNKAYLISYYKYKHPEYITTNTLWQYNPECTKSYNSITKTACNSYVLNGKTYNQTGIYTQNLKNVNGCDSIITVNLTIIPTSTSTITKSVCSSYTLNGKTYSQTRK